MISDETITKAIALIQKGPTNAEYFFEKLSSPAWIEPLRRKNLFAPYPAERRGDMISFPFWSPGKYLVRMAANAEARGAVASILKVLPTSDNPRVYEDVADAALALPPSLGAQLTTTLLAGLSGKFQLLLPGKAAKVIVKLADAGFASQAITLARALFALTPSTPVPPDDDGTSSLVRGEAKGRFDSYEYGELLDVCVPGLAASDALGTVALLCDLLEVAVESGSLSQADGAEDYSYIWQPLIRVAEDRRNSIRNDLVVGLRDAGETIGNHAPDRLPAVLAEIAGRPTNVFRRIVLHLLSLFGERLLPEVQRWLEDSAVRDDHGLRPEYNILLARFFGDLPGIVQQHYLEWVNAGPDVDEYVAWRQRLDGTTPDEVDKAGYVGVWKRDRLGIVRMFLGTGSHATTLERLEAEYGAAPEPGPLSRGAMTWVGERSPLTQEEADQLPWPALLGYLRTWKPSDDPEGPSEAGLANAVRQKAVSDAGGAIVALAQAEELHAAYAVALVEGIAGARRDGAVIDWAGLLDSLYEITSEAQTADGLGGNDRQLVGVRRSAISLVEDALSQTPDVIPFENRALVWKLIVRVTDDPDPTPQHEDRHGGNPLDALTLSLNTVRGKAFHAVAKYALWVRRNIAVLSGDTTTFDSMPEVRAVLESHLDASNDPSLAVRATYGQWFPWWVLLDEEWAKSHRDLIFPDAQLLQEYWHAAWEAYIVYCSPYSTILPILHPTYAKAIAELAAPSASAPKPFESPTEHLAQHLMAYYWRGELGLEEGGLVRQFFARAAEDHRRKALKSIGWSLHRAESAPGEEVTARLQALWNWRMQVDIRAELGAFGSWFGSGRLDLPWSLWTLETVLSKSILPTPGHQVVQRLAAIAPQYPAATIRCLAWMVELASHDWSIHGWIDEARVILRAGLNSDDDDTKARSEQLIQKLVAMRYRDFRTLLVEADSAGREGRADAG
ncbi:MAG: hypothetical protein V4558_02250 [Gemmatimonadota bacterium]